MVQSTGWWSTLPDWPHSRLPERVLSLADVNQTTWVVKDRWKIKSFDFELWCNVNTTVVPNGYQFGPAVPLIMLWSSLCLNRLLIWLSWRKSNNCCRLGGKVCLLVSLRLPVCKSSNSYAEKYRRSIWIHQPWQSMNTLKFISFLSKLFFPLSLIDRMRS